MRVIIKVTKPAIREEHTKTSERVSQNEPTGKRFWPASRLAQWLARWRSKYAKLCEWVEDNIKETLTYYRLPPAHHKHMKSTNMLEQLNQEIKRRTHHPVRIFPNAQSCSRLIRTLAVETHEDRSEAIRYLNLEHLRERKEELLRLAA